MSIERHKKREHGTTREEEKEEVMKNQIEGEIIKNRNDDQECDQQEEWPYDGCKPKRHKKTCDGSDQKRYNKKKRRHTHKKENKEEGKDTHGGELRCVECKKKFDSTEEIIKHINKNEYGGWTCCETYLRIQEKKEHRKRTGQDVERENNKEKEIEREKNTQENKEKYKKEDEKTSTIKEPDIAKGLIKKNQHRFPYTKSNDKSKIK